MIQFKCHCGEKLSVPQDLAGGSIQCPRCGRLNDVPTLSDLGHIEDDGIFKLSEPTAEVEARRLENLKTAFSLGTTTADGQEIDLRPTMADVRKVGVTEEIALAPDGTTPTKAPKYDPVTGELVRPLAVQPVAAAQTPAAIPLARPVAKPDEQDAEGPHSLMEVLVDLLSPVNLIVMAFVVIGYLMVQIVKLVLVPLAEKAGGSPSAAQFVPTLPLLALILGHYANVIEETGPLAKDDVPRPLRSLDLGDDLIRPLFRMAVAIILCYWPVVVVGLASGLAPAKFHIDWRAKLILVAFGTWAMPAVALTTTCSGTLLNLRPDRILSVMTACGGRYIVAVVLWMLAVALFLATMAVLCITPEAATAGDALVYRRLAEHRVFYPLLCVSIYFMHAACVYLGMLYRRHIDDFGWAYQRHVHVPREEPAPAARLSRERAAGASAAGASAAASQPAAASQSSTKDVAATADPKPRDPRRRDPRSRLSRG